MTFFVSIQLADCTELGFESNFLVYINPRTCIKFGVYFGCFQ